MRIKILIFPVILAIVITICIAYIRPEFQKLKVIRDGIKTSETILAEARQKKDNIEKLKADLAQNKSKEDFVNSYMPIERSDEEIINGFNYLATNSGVSLSDISVEKPAAAKTAASEPAQPASSKDVIFATSADSSITDVTGSILNPEIRYTKIKVGISGSYDSIKNFLDQTYKMEMFNKIVAFGVSSGAKTDSGETETGNPSALSATIEADFGRMASVVVGKDYSAPIFGKTTFDMSGYNKLDSNVIRKIPAIEVGAKGRSNPFSPQ